MQLDPSTFQNYTHLIKLDLSVDELQYLPAQIFSALIHLNTLDVSHIMVGTLSVRHGFTHTHSPGLRKQPVAPVILFLASLTDCQLMTLIF